MNKLNEQEIKRDKLNFNKFVTSVITPALILVNYECRTSVKSTSLRREISIMRPKTFLEESFVRISIASLYRRYLSIRVQTMYECLAIIKNSSQKEEIVEKIKMKLSRELRTSILDTKENS